MEINNAFLEKYNKLGPRYTSYPPAPFFSIDYTNEKFIENVVQSNTETPQNISIYIHIPFCPQLCHFCGCTTYTGVKATGIEAYIDALVKEIEFVAPKIDKSRSLTQVHWGGGTPNAIAYKHIERVTNVIKKHFDLSPNYEMAMECSPAYLSFQNIEQLASFGFNRISLGVQDLKQDVLDAINRKGPKHPIHELIAKMRSVGFKSVNIDLVYGLPKQTVDSFSETIKAVLEMDPDRIVTFSYAHVPGVMSRQLILEEIGLPTPDSKIQMYQNAYNLITEAGYSSIGMDHFAKPNDEIAIALGEHKLHRNFQGYCTRETTGQVYGFGASSISQLHSSYAQNEKNMNRYVESINKDGLAIEKGYRLSKDEQIVRELINEVMCNYYLDFDLLAQQFDVTVDYIFKLTHYSEEKFRNYMDDGLLDIEGNIMSILLMGRMVIRNIAMEFDPKLNQIKGHFSQTV